MATFHRVTALVLAALLLAGGASVVATVIYLPGPYSFTAADGEQFSFSPLSTSDKLISAAVGLGVLLAGILLLATEVLGPPSRQRFPVRSSGQTLAWIERQSVEQRLADVVQRLPGVVRAAPRVQLGRHGIDVETSLLTDPDIAVPALCDQAYAAIQRALRDDLGLQPGSQRIRVRDAAPPNEALAPVTVGAPRD